MMRVIARPDTGVALFEGSGKACYILYRLMGRFWIAYRDR